MGKFDHIPELTGASVFQTWKAQIILALGREDVYNHISDRTDPTDIAEFASVMPTPAATALTAAEKKLIQDWLKDDAIAKDIICRCLSPTILQHIPQERSSTARDAWKLLHSLFDHIDLGSQYLVREKIFGLQMKDAKDAQCYLGEHETLRRDLVQMGVAYSDSKAVFNLLKGLPRTGTWPAFKLMLQTSISTTTSAIPTSASGSSISQILSTARGTTFENVSAHVVAEAHRQLLESSLISPLGTEHAHAILPSGHGNSNSINPVTSLRRTRNNPSGTYCDTPLGMVPLVGHPTTIGPIVSNQAEGWLVSSLHTGGNLKAGANPALPPQLLLQPPRLLLPRLRHLLPSPVFPHLIRGRPGITTCLVHPSSRLGMIPPPVTFWPVLPPLETPAYSTRARRATSFVIGPTYAPTLPMIAYGFERQIMGTFLPQAVASVSVS